MPKEFTVPEAVEVAITEKLSDERFLNLREMEVTLDLAENIQRKDPDRQYPTAWTVGQLQRRNRE